MPELPEVETIRRGLEKTVRGKTIRDVEVRLPKIVSLGPSVVSNIRKGGAKKTEIFRRDIRGHKIVSITRRSKMLLLKLSGPFTLLIHMKMTVQMIFARRGERKTVKIFNSTASPRFLLPHKYTHVIFKFTDGSALYYNDLRQFGYLRLVSDADMDKVQDLHGFGPEPFDRSFTEEYFRSRARSRPKLSIKQFLMDPKVVAGIGNIYSDEILYWAKVRPARPLRSLVTSEWHRIFLTIPKILKDALAARGSSVGDFFQIDGKEGKYGKKHRVYGRYGQRCYTCHSEIKKIKLGGRTSSYCPNCQK